MRSHVKASTAGSTQRQAGSARPGLISLACLAAISLLTLLAGATPALGAVVTDRPLLFKFNGSDTTAGAFGDQRNLEVNQATGDVYVFDAQKEVIDRFNAAGVAQSFPATGTSSLAMPTEIAVHTATDIAIDNSAANPGRIYVQVDEGPGFAFDPAGNLLWELKREVAFGTGCGAAFDTAGHLWVSDRKDPKQVREFDSTGSPPTQLSSFDYTSGGFFPCRLDLDTAGNMYISSTETGTHKYTGGVFVSTLDASGNSGVAVDRSSPTGHIFTASSTAFKEYESSGALIGTFGAAQLGFAGGIAYNNSLNRVYVADFDGHVVFAFGPVTTGTVPDVTSEAASEVGVSKAKFSGKVNPQSVPNEYFFEWKEGTSDGWGGSKASAPQALPEDSSEHAVSFNATGLKGNTTYQVRTVARNTANGLLSYANAVTFSTAQAATPPAVTIAAPSPVTTTSAQVSGTVNPEEDFGTTWLLQTSTDPACASGFADRPIHDLESEASTPVAVGEELTGLLPSQHYCVRMTASNSFGSVTSETKEFTTDPVIPAQVFTAFAAPRTDTTARLNGRVDPQGAPLTYSFEYSKDGGATWIDLPDGEETSEAREQIVVASELSGLTPNTTYSYRFSAENAAGEAATQGAVETFTTRTSAAMSPPERGIELVNNPDKGNQRVSFLALPLLRTSILSADGEKAFWSVTGGAPGGTTGTGATFLAKRTADGWRSTGLIPPATQQIGGGQLAYALAANTPDFSKFIFRVAPSVILGDVTDPVAVRLDEGGNQEILKGYEVPHFAMNELDLSDDGAHVLIEDPVSKQLEDVGGGVPVVVSLMPDGTPAECLLTGNIKNFQLQPDYHVMSTTDGSRVYFQARPNGSCGGLTQYGLYVRNRDSALTTLIDPGASGKDPELIRATPDGRSAFFISPTQLDPADANGGKDVYRWDEASGESSCLTCVVADAGVEGRVMVSDDFSHVYFESTRQLVAGLGEAGHKNVYALSAGELRFVTDAGFFGGLSNGDAKLSADGEVLAFRADARRSLSADDVAAQCIDPGTGSNGGCLELYRYDDREGSVECVSCDHGGTTTESFASHGGLSDLDFRLSADGSTIGFLTSEGLVHLDVNKGFDVYEWREGARRLITDGVSTLATGLSRPMVLAVDADGSDLLFAIVPPNGSLTGFEQDGQVNLYDARIGGGFEPPGAPVHCKEDSCQGPLVAPPAPPPASSSSFAGHGNLAPQKARKKRRPCARKRGKAKQRCVRKQKRRAQKARANHNAGRGK